MMKKMIVMFILLTSSASIFAVNCMDTAKNQLEINTCSASETKTVEAELDQVYKQVLAVVKKDTSATNKVRKAQEAWIKYRNAQIEMYYPPRPDGWYGSFHPVCINGLTKKLSENRIEELRAWLKQPEEGDPCARRMKEGT